MRGEIDEIAHAVLPSGGDDVVFGSRLLQDQPLCLDVVPGVPPVPARIQVAEVEAVLQAELDPRQRPRNLARHESLAPDRGLVVEEDAVAGVHAVGLAVVHRDPVGVELRRAVGRARVEGRGFLLRRFHHPPKKLGGGRLVEARLLLHAEDAHRFQQPERADAVRVGGVLGLFEAHRDMALRGEVVDFVGLRLLHDACQAGRIGHVAVMQD